MNLVNIVKDNADDYLRSSVESALVGTVAAIIGRSIVKISAKESFCFVYGAYFVSNLVNNVALPLVQMIEDGFGKLAKHYSSRAEDNVRSGVKLLGRVGYWTMGAMVTREILGLNHISACKAVFLTISSIIALDVISDLIVGVEARRVGLSS